MHEQEPQPQIAEQARARPRILVGPNMPHDISSAYWLDAAEPLAQLEAAVAIITGDRHSYWIHASDRFGEIQLRPQEPLSVVAAMATAVRRYGPAFAAWAQSVGVTAADERDFRGCYLGSWASLAAFGSHFAADLGLSPRSGVSHDLRPYVAIDGEALVLDMVGRRELQIIEEGRGLFHFFIGPGSDNGE